MSQQKVYFDNLGNSLQLIDKSNFDYINVYQRLSNKEPIVMYDMNIKDINGFVNSVKPIAQHLFKKDNKAETWTYGLNGLQACYIDDDTILTQNLEFVINKTKQNYFNFRINASNNYNEFIADNILIQDLGYYKQLMIRVYGILVGDPDTQEVTHQLYFCIKSLVNDNGTESMIELQKAGTAYYYSPIIGGSKTTWNAHQLDLIPINGRSQDPSGIIEPGGGFGTGKNETDSIPEPSPITINTAICGTYLYRLIPTQMSAFTKWLWDGSLATDITKLFRNPMDAIIGISVTDAPISEGTLQDIVVGNITAQYPVDNSYVQLQGYHIDNWVYVDCGSINLEEFYGSFADYAPYVQVQLYLPKVGFVSLPTDICMNNSIFVAYNIELVSGEGMCYVYITDNRDGIKYIYNQYNCKCNASIPISGEDNRAFNSAFISASIGGVSALMGGSPLSMANGITGMFSGIGKERVNNIGNMGNFSSIMGYSKPYIIVNRTTMVRPESYVENNGYMIGYTATIGNHTGFLQTNNYHAEFNAPAEHKAEIERIMNSGVFIQ